MSQIGSVIIDPAPASAGEAMRAGPAAPVSAEWVPAERIGEHRAAWSDLTERALDQNIFLEPAFAMPLAQHGAAARRLEFLLVWEGLAGPAPRLIALLPIRLPRLPIVGCARGFSDKMVPLGTPLLDRDRAADGFTALLDALRSHPRRPAVLTLTAVPAEAAFLGATLPALAPARAAIVLASHSRAALRGTETAGSNVLPLQSAKSRKERQRQRRRLDEHGQRAYVSARSPAAVATATETFLALEHRGWKGVRGTALLSSAAAAAFTRAMMREMAGTGKGRVDALELNGEAVAMGLILTGGARAHFWKTTFDESLAALSPGVQFTSELAEMQAADPEVTLTDSCAVPDHPMIDKVWPHRITLVDLAVEVGSRGSLAWSIGIRLERARRQVYSLAKRFRRRLGRRRGAR